MNTARSHRLARLAVGFALIVPATSHAQSAATPDSSATAVSVSAKCRHPLKASDAEYDAALQSLELRDTSSRLTAGAGRLNERIARAMRHALGGSETLVPRADSLGIPTEVDGAVPLALIVHRDGPTTWQVDAGSRGEPARLAGVYRAVLGTMSRDDLLLEWQNDVAADSAVLMLRLSKHALQSADAIHVGRTSSAVFVTVRPLDFDTPPVYERTSGLFVPYDIRESRTGWRIVMEATIDEDGNVEKRSVRDVPSLALATDSAHFEHDYKRLVDAARQSMLDSKYFPARSGGCAVAEQVHQPFYVNMVPKG